MIICATYMGDHRTMIQTLMWTWKTENNTCVVGLNFSEQQLSEWRL